jgi:hypothetical protein
MSFRLMPMEMAIFPCTVKDLLKQKEGRGINSILPPVAVMNDLPIWCGETASPSCLSDPLLPADTEIPSYNWLHLRVRGH